MMDTVTPLHPPISDPSPAAPAIGIVIPTYQEETTLTSCLRHLEGQSPPFEVMVVDGGSSDRTLALAQDLVPHLTYPCQAGLAPQRGRAAQMNWGAQQIQAPILLFLHADSQLPNDGLDQIRSALQDPGVVGGRFQVELDSQAWPYPLITWGINTRSQITGCFTGDMGIFIRRAAFQHLEGYPLQPLMEDLDLSEQMAAFGRRVFLPGAIQTSSRRWQQQGPWRTVILMQILRASYRLGVKPDQLARWYRHIR